MSGVRCSSEARSKLCATRFVLRKNVETVEALTHLKKGRASVRARLHVVEAAAELVGAHCRGQVFRAFRDRYSHDKRLFHLARVGQQYRRSMST